MASNDTNSWDEDPHELMRQRWQQAFADHRIQASPALTRRIFDSPGIWRRRRRMYWMVTVLGSLVCLLGVGVGQLNSPPIKYTSLVKRPSEVSSPSVQPANAVGQATSRPPTNEARPRGGIAQRNGPHSDNDLTRKSLSGATQVTAQIVSTKTTSSGRPPSASRSRVRKMAAPNPFIQNGVSRDSQYISGDSSRDDYPTRPIGTLANVSVRWRQMEPVSRLPLSVSIGPLPGILPGQNDLLPSSTIPMTGQRNRRWFMEINPLSNFQLMTAPPNPAAYLSSVKSPSAFAPDTWGLQLAGGVRWQRWQVQGTIGYLRRWAYYTINENSYRVVSTASNPSQLVRETYTVSENKLLPLVGIGLSKQQLLFHSRYAAEIGGQAYYLPTSDQSLIGLRGSIARRFSVSRGSELQVGLKMEYGLNQLSDGARHLLLHPLLMGIGLRIQPRLD